MSKIFPTKQISLDATVIHHIRNPNAKKLVEALKKGGSPHAVDELGFSAIHNSVKGERVDLTKILLDFGADSSTVKNLTTTDNYLLSRVYHSRRLDAYHLLNGKAVTLLQKIKKALKRS